MKRGIFLLLLFILFCRFVISDITIEVDETELISLDIDATDPDNEQLEYIFEPPLNDIGEWQTTHGDAGTYDTLITVSDGELSSTEKVHIIVNKKEEGPTIDSHNPIEDPTIKEGEEIKFEISASDLNKDPLNYQWELDGKRVSETTDFLYKTDYFSEGEHLVTVYVTDQKLAAAHEWTINVEDFDRSTILDSLGDITVEETETIKLELPDFQEYNLQYDISEPIGNDGEWKTTYDDAGEHKVTIKIWEEGFIESKEITITVNNLDRPPVFSPIKNIRINENQELTIKLEAVDPDNEEVEFLAESLPDGASLEGDTFKWTPSFDTVKKESLLHNILGKYHLLSKSFRITFIAKNRLETRQGMRITVYEGNRKPILNDLHDITINEGEKLIIEPEATDPDGDKLKLSYSGFTKKKTYTTDYDDAGKYLQKVTASDGFSSDTKGFFITVNDVNRPPSFEEESFELKEGETITTQITATDHDQDQINIKAEQLPSKATFIDEMLEYTPIYETVEHDSTKIGIRFIASDEELEETGQFNFTVNNVNRAPEIIGAVPAYKEFTTYTGNRMTYEVVAEDPDNDNLVYIWKFGLFEKYTTNSSKMIRTFTQPGKKTVAVTVSDGIDKVSHKWKTKVVSHGDYLKIVKG